MTPIIENQKIRLQAMHDQRTAGLNARLEEIERIARDGPDDTEHDRLLVIAVFSHVAGSLYMLRSQGPLSSSSPSYDAPAPLATTRGGDITHLLELAIERGIDVASMEKLVALHERVEAKNAEKEYARALAEFQADCPLIPRNSTAKIVSNSGTSRTQLYAALDDIARAIAQPLRQHGFSYSFDCEEAPNGKLKVTCTLRHTAGHAEKHSFPIPTATTAAMSDQQKYASALTYARRQTLVQALGLTMTDPDADGAEPPPSPETISEEQQKALDKLIVDVGATKERFLKHLGVAKLSELSVNHFDRAVADLEEFRVAQAKRKAGVASNAPKEPEAETVVAFPTESAPVPDLEFAREVAALYKEFPADIRGKLRVEHALPLGADIYPFIKTWDRPRLANLNAVLKGL